MCCSFTSRLFYIALLSCMFSCGKPLPHLENVDLTVWKSDPDGCQGQRALMVEQFKLQKNKMLGLSEAQIIELLGKPDENELYTRNQKFYYYFFTAGPECAVPAQTSQVLNIRFNATGLAKEVAIE